MAMSPTQQAMLETFQQHMTAELAGDIEATMGTMTDNPHVNHVPVMTGGVGLEGVRQFYRNHLVGKFFPPKVARKSKRFDHFLGFLAVATFSSALSTSA
jgi:carboxymethylenebutenolidase